MNTRLEMISIEEIELVIKPRYSLMLVLIYQAVKAIEKTYLINKKIHYQGIDIFTS
ncbi:hypothetical protein GO003_009635 [Methylicorpusculum oleiharenae]|uniref:hypothetical protein n=1 Tax=Methylicorpusculum oleiharenae TaxID=1338687 RepID=UPI00135BD62C|nr:hypothetical protein [Methylicorpusculum oleiharenae]MCD2450651.1 hypothetical protein [Methylicorpusculum oleiharenae]